MTSEIACLPQRPLAALGQALRRAFDVPRTDIFDHLLDAIERAETARASQRPVPTGSARLSAASRHAGHDALARERHRQRGRGHALDAWVRRHRPWH